MTSGLSKCQVKADAHLPLPAGSIAYGPVDHPTNPTIGGNLIRLSSGIFVIAHGGTFSSCPQTWAKTKIARKNKLTKARHQGREANRLTLALCENPYTEGSEDFAQWEKGWKDVDLANSIFHDLFDK